MSAPSDILWATNNGNYFVAAKNARNAPDFGAMGKFESFYPGCH